jgi:outer membrane protein OmpA-like peptidoglycan-associated protein
MKLPNLTPEEQKKFANGVIQVNGKAMNRTALGIIDAFFKLYPNTTFAELKEAFPDSINPSGPRAPKTIFKPFTDRDFGVVHSLEEIKAEFSKAGLSYEGLFFLEPDEMFKTSDGVTVIVNKLWESKDTETGESDLENLTKAALKYGIVVNKFEPRTPFGKGSYSLDILQPELFEKISGKTKIIEKEVIREKTVEKKVIPFWIWIVLSLVLIIPLILWLAGAFKSEPVIKEVVKMVKQVDTVYVKEIENIEAKFNSVQFTVGSFEIPEEAKFALYDLAKFLKKQPNLKLKIEGHTSDEGDPNFNQQLSEKRAKAVVDFLINRGVDASRLSYEGKGSSMPIDKNNREVNRRTEFIIINQ